MLKPLACVLLLSSTLSFSFAEEVKTPTSPQPTLEKTSTSANQNTPAEDSSSASEVTDDIFEDVEINDPLEYLNRGMHYVNGAIDYALIKPLALGYRWVVPEVARNRIDDFLTNLRTPIFVVNHILQGEPKRAFHSLSSFVVNSTAGFLGFYNTAHHLGLKRIETNFNETLGRWGVDTGPYLIVPILGSCSFRGVVGLGADYFSDPVTLYLLFNGPAHESVSIGSYVRTGVHTINEREKYIEIIEELQKTSEDMYATLRGIYFQTQKKKIEELRNSSDVEEINTSDDAPASLPSLN